MYIFKILIGKIFLLNIKIHYNVLSQHQTLAIKITLKNLYMSIKKLCFKSFVQSFKLKTRAIYLFILIKLPLHHCFLCKNISYNNKKK